MARGAAPLRSRHVPIRVATPPFGPRGCTGIGEAAPLRHFARHFWNRYPEISSHAGASPCSTLVRHEVHSCAGNVRRVPAAPAEWGNGRVAPRGPFREARRGPAVSPQAGHSRSQPGAMLAMPQPDSRAGRAFTRPCHDVFFRAVLGDSERANALIHAHWPKALGWMLEGKPARPIGAALVCSDLRQFRVDEVFPVGGRAAPGSPPRAEARRLPGPRRGRGRRPLVAVPAASQRCGEGGAMLATSLAPGSIRANIAPTSLVGLRKRFAGTVGTNDQPSKHCRTRPVAIGCLQPLLGAVSRALDGRLDRLSLLSGDRVWPLWSRRACQGDVSVVNETVIRRTAPGPQVCIDSTFYDIRE